MNVPPSDQLHWQLFQLDERPDEQSVHGPPIFVAVELIDHPNDMPEVQRLNSGNEVPVI